MPRPTPAGHYYDIELNGYEISTLWWMVQRGYFPEEAFDGLELVNEETYLESMNAVQEHEQLKVDIKWRIPEHAAWSILQLRDDDPDAYLTCCGGTLLPKLVELEQSIV